MNLHRVLMIMAAVTLLCGCSRVLHGFAPDCHKRQEYQRAAQLPPLKVPAGLDTPNTQGALVIPTVELAAPPPGRHDTCLDAPPRYKAAPPNKRAAAAEEAGLGSPGARATGGVTGGSALRDLIV